ncbi:MAG TPA: Hsp20/alpha crystallin family protein [Vicinamibacteria bacterium]|nr:Hsp20/alpha crystallin family protein [Vicinamibacteria bacterium]
MSMPHHADPLQQLLDLQERMNRLFEETLGRERLDEPHLPHRTWAPAADVFETAAGYVVEIDLPGVRREEVSVQVAHGALVIRGEKPPSTTGRSETFHRLERLDGPFARSFRLPQAVDPEGVTAELADGVLRVTLPKPRQAHRLRFETGE